VLAAGQDHAFYSAEGVLPVAGIFRIFAVSLTKIRHAGLDPASSKLLRSLDSGSAKDAVRNDGILF